MIAGKHVVVVMPAYNAERTIEKTCAMVGMVSSGLYQCVLASRILGDGALTGGMPMWRYVPTRFLTFAGNLRPQFTGVGQRAGVV
jgi:hypothetical protein